MSGEHPFCKLSSMRFGLTLHSGRCLCSDCCALCVYVRRMNREQDHGQETAVPNIACPAAVILG